MDGGRKLRELRKGLGLTTEQLGSRLGVSQATISRIENGRRPDWATMGAIVAFSDGAITPNDFVLPAAERSGAAA